jgi:hypothetical protein
VSLCQILRLWQIRRGLDVQPWPDLEGPPEGGRYVLLKTALVGRGNLDQREPFLASGSRQTLIERDDRER